MENTAKNIELIDKFIENQRKSKMWAIISVSLFLVMAAFVFFFSIQLSETKNKLTVSEQKLFDANERLSFLNDSIQKVKDSVMQVNYSLEKNTDKIDSLKSVNDTLTILLNTTQQEYIKTNSATATEKINKIYQDAFPGMEQKVSDNIKEAIKNTNEIKKDAAATRVIFIQYMPRYKDLCIKIKNQLLKNQKIKIESPEPIWKTTFNPTIRYFHDEDKETAEDIARVLNKSYASELKQPFIIQKIALKAPLYQLEIWIGLYEQNKLYQQKDFYEQKKL